MKFYLLFFWFLYSFVSISQIEKDTIIEINGNTIESYSTSYSNGKIHVGVSELEHFFGVLDTNLKLLNYHKKYDGMFEIGFNKEDSILAVNYSSLSLNIKVNSSYYKQISKNKFQVPINQYHFFENFLLIEPYYHTRDSLGNLFFQRINFNDSLFQSYTIQYSQNYGYCHLGYETTIGLIPYLLTAKDSGGYYEFGYFDSVFNRIDTFKFRHPDIQPNKGLNRFSAREIFVKNNLLYVAGSNQIKSTNNVPYKFAIDLKTKKIISTWQNVPEDLNAKFSVFRINKYYFDSRGNLFFVGRADTKKDESWRNWHGFLQMVDINNNLLVDTLYQFNPATNNETDFIYHLGGGRVILGGHYNYNTGITPAAWYKKFNIKDWYLPSVGINEEPNQENKFLVYPNPGNSTIKIEGHLNEIQEMRLTDIQGKVLIEKSVFNQVDISKFPNGVYFLNIKMESGKTETHKIIK